MPPGVRMTSGESPRTVKGSCAMICDEDTLKGGSAILLRVAHTSPSVDGSGNPLAEAGPCARPVPPIWIRPPGATAIEWSALLVTLETDGGVVAASKLGATTAMPDIVSSRIEL